MQELMALYQGQSLNTITTKLPEPFSKEEEIDIFEKYQKCKSVDFYREIVHKNLRFVAHIVRGYKSSLNDMELFQEGTIGLMKSVKKFDLKHGVRFTSFAVWHIKHEINEFIIKNISSVKSLTTKALKKLFYNQEVIEGNGLSVKGVKETANTLNVSTKDVRDFVMRKNGFVKEELEYTTENGEGVSFSKIDDIEYNLVNDLIDEELSVNRSQALQDALNNLSCRERDIVVSSYFQNEPLRVLAERWEVSTERIRQLKGKALKHLTESMT